MLDYEITPASAGTAYITASASPSQGGSVSPTSRSCTIGSYLSIFATPNFDYEFDGWYTGSLQVSYSAMHTFYVSRSESFTAKFIKMHTVTLQCDIAAGTVSGGKRVRDGEYIWISASPHRDYKFEGWYKNGVRLGLAAYDKYTPTESCTLTAKFTHISTYTVTLVSQSTIQGRVSGGGSVTQGNSLLISALPNVGYAFDGWHKNGRLESYLSVYRYTPTESCTLEARFYATVRYTVTVQSEDVNKGTVSGGGVVATGETVSIRAVPKPDYMFEGWYINGSKQNYLNASSTYTVTDACILVAKFQKSHFKINIKSEDTNKGTVINGGEVIVANGSVVNFSCSPISNLYQFDAWYFNDIRRPELPISGSFKPTDDGVLEARFKERELYTVSLVSSVPSMILTGGGIVPAGDSVFISAESWSGPRRFDAWYYKGVRRTDIPRTGYFTPPGTCTLEAKLKEGVVKINLYLERFNNYWILDAYTSETIVYHDVTISGKIYGGRGIGNITFSITIPEGKRHIDKILPELGAEDDRSGIEILPGFTISSNNPSYNEIDYKVAIATQGYK